MCEVKTQLIETFLWMVWTPVCFITSLVCFVFVCILTYPCRRAKRMELYRTVHLEGTCKDQVQLPAHFRADQKVGHIIKGIIHMLLVHWWTWSINHWWRWQVRVISTAEIPRSFTGHSKHAELTWTPQTPPWLSSWGTARRLILSPCRYTRHHVLLPATSPSSLPPSFPLPARSQKKWHSSHPGIWSQPEAGQLLERVTAVVKEVVGSSKGCKTSFLLLLFIYHKRTYKWFFFSVARIRLVWMLWFSTPVWSCSGAEQVGFGFSPAKLINVLVTNRLQGHLTSVSLFSSLIIFQLLLQQQKTTKKRNGSVNETKESQRLELWLAVSSAKHCLCAMLLVTISRLLPGCKARYLH